MKKNLFLFCVGVFTTCIVIAQNDAPNVANSATLPAGAALASKITGSSVNIFTGQPTLSVPIYSFKNNSGLAINVSLEYMGGGLQMGEFPSIVGLGWFLNNGGGSITRIVRGMPDDVPGKGYLYSAAIPSDWRDSANKYYHDSLDAQQDIFQFSFPGHSGNFFIGKNGEIVTVPLQKIKIIPAYNTYQPLIDQYQKLKSFRIITEDGVKYDFEEADYNSVNIDNSYIPAPSGYLGMTHAVSWSLTRMVSPFSNDTITFNYIAGGNGQYNYKLPQITYVNNSNGSRKNPANAIGFGYTNTRKISSIKLPDKTTVSFVYSFGTKYNSGDYALSKIQIRDTAFRFGYLLDYDSVAYYWTPGHNGGGYITGPIKLMLKSVTPYTKYEKQNGYTFTYNDIIPGAGSPGDTAQNSRDYWGYYNGIYNGDSLIPKISPYNWGADRRPTIYSSKGSLSSVTLPTGGNVSYGYEMNTHYPYIIENNSLSISAQTSSQNNIALRQVYNNKHQLSFLLDKSVSRIGSPPIAGSGNLNVVIKNTAGTTTYISTSISLYDLFYSGLRTLTFNLDTGTYLLETTLANGTSVSGSLPISIQWENRKPNPDTAFDYSGGIRVKMVTRQNGGLGLEGSYEYYNYVREDGKSSGFLGDVPRYDFPFRETWTSGTSPIDYTAICSEPLATSHSVLGATVGYSRVEIVKASIAGSLGKEVQEFTDLKDVNSNIFPTVFPYTPQDLRTWGLGIPKRISVYDSSGNLVKRTVNTIQFDTVVYNNSNFKSLKSGHSQSDYVGNITYWTSRTKRYIGEEYFLSSGRAFVTSTNDTLYHLNSSMSTSYQNITYDSNYNVTKVVSSFDRTRGLEKEERMYYPYHYTVSGGIGKLRDSSILSLPVSTETWITGDSNPRLISLMATSFRSISNGDVKPDTIYTFESKKPVLQSTIGAFDASKLIRNTTYIKPQTYFTSYDSHGNLSEMKSLVSGISNAVITDYDQQYATAKISNATQTDIAYTSFESTNNGNWTIGSAARDLNDKITGKKSYNLSNGNITKCGLNATSPYLLTFWLKSGASASVNNGSIGSAITSHLGWDLYSVSLTGIASVTISGSGLIDEVRLHPKDANMETFQFEPLIGVISTADANNNIGYTEYDKLNRVKVLRDKDRNIIKRFDYTDTTMVVNTAPNWVGFERKCSNYGLPWVDSMYQDLNLFSDSSGYIKAVRLSTFDCNCPGVSANPEYKVVNGTCEQGQWKVTSSVYKKVLVDGYLQWRWVCKYQWCFSDGSTTGYYVEQYNLSPCTVTCGISLD